jgi:SP family galactose:H+ symporter-like MFS transporter
LNENSAQRFIYVIASVAALGGLLFGYDTGVISGAILFIQRDFGLSSKTEEFLVGAVLLGAIIGAAVGGAMADRLGRRISIMIAATVFSFGAIATALSPTVTLLALGRIVVGIAIGAASFVAPLYISEMSPVRLRGSLVTLNQLALTSGIVLSYLVDYLLSERGNWRLMLGLAAIPSAVLLISMFFLPETPRWLISNGRDNRGTDVLKRIRSSAEAITEANDIRAALQKQKPTLHELLQSGTKMAMFVGIGLAVFQQITGVNTIIYYAPTILGMAGFANASSSILATLSVGIVNVIMTAVAAVLMDKVGRRPLLLTGLVGMIFGMAGLGLLFLQNPTHTPIPWLPVVMLMIYIASFALGLGPIFWLLISEIYPLQIRGMAMGITALANWLANFIVAATFLSLTSIFGKAGTFWLYGALGLIAWIFVKLLVPETKHKTLEEIEDHFRAGKHPRRL